jgi:hypothetical protein
MPDPQGGAVTTLVGRARAMQGNYGFSFYGPGNPLPPIVEGQPVRQWDYNPGVNTSATPRHMEPFGFRHLRAFSNVELVRMAIETRKDQLERLDWMIKPRDNKAARSKERDPRCAEIEKFLAKPDGQTLFPSFMRAMDEDLLAIDAACCERVRTRGGKLLGLELVDGATINLLVDETGRRPRGPDSTAYQQVLRGVVWANLANKDLLYLPRNVRSGHLYGFGPVEQIIVTINTIIRRQASQLAYFTESNVPAGLLTAPENWTLEQIKDLQEWLNQLITGNVDAQRKLLWTPSGTKYAAFKDSPIKDEFDEWLARVVAFAFSLPPTPFIRQMNKGTAGEDQDRAEEEGLEPLKLHRKRWLDDLIATEFNASDLEFAFREDVDIDPKAQAEIDDRRLKNGSATLDEVRDRAGDDPYPDGAGARPMVYASDGPIPLEAVDALIERKTMPPEPPVVPGEEGASATGSEGKEPESSKGGTKEPEGGTDEEPAEKLAKARRDWPESAVELSIDRPKALRAIAALKRAVAGVLEEARHDVAAQVERKLPDLGKAERDPRINLEAEAIARSIDLRTLLGMQDVIQEETVEIARNSGSIALRISGIEDPLELVDQVNESALEYAKERAVQLLTFAADANESLVESTRELVRRIIADGLEKNIGRDAIAENIQNGAAFSEARADMIANTEIAMANAAGKKAAYDLVEAQGETLVKQWFVSEDEGVCDLCEGNGGQGEIGFDEAFESGDDMEPAHPNCRCVTVARVVEPNEAGEPGDGE